MFQTGKGPQNNETPAQRGKYFKFQLSGWTDFDPMDKELSEITDAIAQGSGLLSAIEVVEVQDDLAAIKDMEVRKASRTFSRPGEFCEASVTFRKR